MTTRRHQLAERLEAHDLGFEDGYRLRIIEVIEAGTSPDSWITALAQRINRDGSIDRRDDRPRPRSFKLTAIETIDGEPFTIEPAAAPPTWDRRITAPGITLTPAFDTTTPTYRRFRAHADLAAYDLTTQTAVHRVGRGTFLTWTAARQLAAGRWTDVQVRTAGIGGPAGQWRQVTLIPGTWEVQPDTETETTTAPEEETMPNTTTAAEALGITPEADAEIARRLEAHAASRQQAPAIDLAGYPCRCGCATQDQRHTLAAHAGHPVVIQLTDPEDPDGRPARAILWCGPCAMVIRGEANYLPRLVSGLGECAGHPAGPGDPMGETVICDGTCGSGLEDAIEEPSRLEECWVYGCTETTSWLERMAGTPYSRLCDAHKRERERVAGPHMTWQLIPMGGRTPWPAASSRS